MTELFRAEALAAKRELAGPGRLLRRPPALRLWLLLAVLAAAGLAGSLAVRVDSYAYGSARVDPKTGVVTGVIAGPPTSTTFRVVPAGTCPSADVAAQVKRLQAGTAVSAVLPAVCRGRGGLVRLATREGSQPLLVELWKAAT